MSAVAKRKESASNALPLHRFESRPKVITLCGSTRFWEEFQKINAELTLQGNLVFSVAVTSTAANGELNQAQKSILDSVHFHKIRMSDEIFVINPGGYIGESTAREIQFAGEIGRKIRYLEMPADGPLFEN